MAGLQWKYFEQGVEKYFIFFISLSFHYYEFTITELLELLLYTILNDYCFVHFGVEVCMCTFEELNIYMMMALVANVKLLILNCHANGSDCQMSSY